MDEKRSAKELEAGIVADDAIGAEVENLGSSPGSEPNAFQRFTKLLLKWGIETHGCVDMFLVGRTSKSSKLLTCPGQHYNLCSITPIPPEDRTDTRLYQMFFIWCSANLNILA